MLVQTSVGKALEGVVENGLIAGNTAYSGLIFRDGVPYWHGW